MKKTCFFALLFINSLILSMDKFILFTSLYHEQNQERINEYLLCLDKNLHHPLIEKIHIAFDTSCINSHCNNILLDELLKRPVEIDYIKGRPTYGYFFNQADTIYPDRRIIISNADIFFNDTLRRLENYDLSNKFLTITRWQYKGENRIVPYLTRSGENASVSQDTWIFKTPIKNFDNHGIELGTIGCDGKIAKQAYLNGFTVLNPCLTIQCCHVHLTDVRNYLIQHLIPPYRPKELMAVPWSELE